MEASEAPLKSGADNSLSPNSRRQGINPLLRGRTSLLRGQTSLLRGQTSLLRGALLLLAGIATAALFLHDALLGQLLAAALAGGVLLVWAFRQPLLPPLGLLLVLPFNYGFNTGMASIKLSELVAGAMLAVIVLRLAAGDASLYRRLRRTGLPVVALALLGLLAVVTAIPHPNVFNVRYELENYIACAYLLLFFRRAWWPPLLLTMVAMLGIEAVVALVLKFVLGISGTSFFDTGGVKLIQFTQAELDSFAGGRFRLSGTMGHKNLLAAFFVLFLPVISLEMLRRARLLWLAAIVPCLVVLALTDSMTGWSAMAVVIVLALVHVRRFDYLAVLGLLALPVAGFCLYKFGDSVFLRINQLSSGREGWGTVSSRQEIYRIAMNLIHQYPWTGIGRNNFLTYGRTYYGHAHNMFLMKVIEMGIPAGILFGGVILALLGQAWRAILHETERLAAERQYYRALGLWLGCLGFTGMNLFDYNYANFGLGTAFMALLGILLAIALDLEALDTASPSATHRAPASAADALRP